MTHGSLFSGIGGFDLAAQWMGWTNVFHCEMNPFGQRVLAHHFPNSKLHEDVTTFPSADYTGRIDILSGGFPCQPYSTAGKRLGTEDDRHLWPAMLDVIRGIQPRWVVGENVRGLVNWNGGMVFEEVCADLENSGYAVQPYLLPAAAVGAPHLRNRIWFVAHANDRRAGCEVQAGRDEPAGGGERHAANANRGRLEGAEKVGRNCFDVERKGGPGLAADTESSRGGGLPKRKTAQKPKHGIACSSGNASYADGLRGRQDNRQGIAGQPYEEIPRWDAFPTQPPVCGGDDGLPRELDGITFPKWRAESIKAYGNAIVPQVALQIFKAIHEYETQ